MSKVYTVPDLFFNRWDQVSALKKTELWPLINELGIRHEALLKDDCSEEDKTMYGFVAIGVLRRLRKNVSLVDKINVEQAVDCLNDLKFIHEPWYDFPVKNIGGFTSPGEKMHLISFDQFIFALKEFYLLGESKDPSKDIHHLARLTAIVYLETDKWGKLDPVFNPDRIERNAEIILRRMKHTELHLKVKPWHLLSVLYTFTNILEYITKVRCKVLFEGGGKGSGNEHPIAVWLKIKYRLGESGYFNGKKEVEEARIYEALDYLCDLQNRK